MSEKEATTPLMADFEPAVDAKEDNVQYPQSGDLPRPNTTSNSSRISRKQKQVLHIFVLFGLLCTFALWTRPFSPASGRSLLAAEDESAEITGYWSGVATKGMKFALPRPHKNDDHRYKHHDKHEHHDDDNKHKGHGKHGHDHHKHPKPHHPIPPKIAEKIFLEVPNNASVAAASRRYTAYAHPAGSGYDFYSALNLKNEWERQLGLRVSGADEFVFDAGTPESQERVRNGMDKLGVWVDTYYPVMNTPVHASVTLLTDPPFKAKLQEDIVKGDPDSELRDEVPVFHGFSASGDVTAPYIYAGYGRKKDIDLLQAKGIDFNGKIVLVKYGGCFRGLKVKAAQEAGAVGVIVFTDPGDDGEITQENGYEVYPDGPARQPSSVQRGSVQFLSSYPGDPSTPGEPAYKNATRAEVGNQPSIPSLPVSYEDVIPILKALEGKGIHASELGDDWVGGLGFHGVDYFVGPSEVDLHLYNEMNERVMPIWNTMAVIPGHITDEVVILGNHRDAWVLGASDPNSGTASQYEVVRGFGALLQKGWKPLRTIVLTSWDAEEYGLIGSVEWAEDFGDWLVENAVAYLNMDSSASGSNFHAGASPSLALLLKSAAEEVESSLDPSRSVYSTKYDAGSWEAFELAKNGHHVGEIDPWAIEKGSGIKALGSGSDFTPFLQRYGIASSDLGYTGGPKDAVYHYHSIYDSYTWQAKYGDVGFHRHTDAAKVIGLFTLRMADTLILPLNTTQYARDLAYYLEKVEAVLDENNFSNKINLDSLASSIKSVQSASATLDEQRAKALEKLRKLLPKPKHFKPSFWQRLAPSLSCAHASAEMQGAQLPTWDDKQEDVGAVVKEWPRLPSPSKLKEIKKVLKEIRSINKKLQHFEHGFISEEGITSREWYKHKGVAPGYWLGYGATTFPALTEAITIAHSAELAQKEANDLADLIEGIAKRLKA
ncbi:membrane protein [Kwoniella heveanensis BCC8398]|uniref:Membrane protein n=1 Tax=Kwoniella heveanensis BCC8398 TaxID=1296120 RepID=A0A1B9H0L6_9TREE|nr:membrane protein [Kwoniella heveanensis BCC8398]